MIGEAEIKAAGADKAPRITPADIEANISREFYFTAAQGAHAAWLVEPRESQSFTADDVNSPLALLTFCVLVLQNGFTVTGESACASPENFNAEIGRKIARENAIQKVWAHMGYELRSKLAERAAYKSRTGLEDRRGLAQTVVVMGEDFPLGKACDLSGDGTCEACQ